MTTQQTQESSDDNDGATKHAACAPLGLWHRQLQSGTCTEFWFGGHLHIIAFMMAVCAKFYLCAVDSTGCFVCFVCLVCIVLRAKGTSRSQMCNLIKCDRRIEQS